MPRPFRLTAPLPRELEIHEALANALDALLLPPAVWRCYPAGHIKLLPAQAAHLMRVGLKPSWPDIDIVYEGLIFSLELKRPGGRLSKTRIVRTRKGSPRILEGQEDMFPKLRAAGMAIAIVYSVDEALAQIRRWGIPLRAHQLAA